MPPGAFAVPEVDQGQRLKLVSTNSPRTRHTAARGGIQLYIREDPGLSVSAGDGVFGHLIQGAPGRIRTCAHGSGAQVRP